MADNRTMAQLLQAPTEGYEDAIVNSLKYLSNFELKHAVVENFLDKMPPDMLENYPRGKSKVRNSHTKCSRLLKRVRIPSTSREFHPTLLLLQPKSGALPSQTVTNPREHVNAITTRSGKTCEGPSTPLVPTPVIPTPLKELERNPEMSKDKVQKPEIGLKDALIEMPKSNKWLSALLRNKEKLEEIAITTVNAECSAIILNKVPRSR
ncbi:hypothetical protein Tco_0397801 [Tanacetum coccineum]